MADEKQGKQEQRNWDRLSKPPLSALKTIGAGRLKGKSDINPQWRYQAMTEVYGECGIGWKYEIVKLWTVPGPKDQVFAFAEVHVSTRNNIDDAKHPQIWNDPIPGIGGSMMVALESSGLHANDEGFKMAVTDALGTAMKMLGVAAEIYLGNFDGSKYIDRDSPAGQTKPIYKTPAPPPASAPAKPAVQAPVLSIITGVEKVTQAMKLDKTAEYTIHAGEKYHTSELKFATIAKEVHNAGLTATIEYKDLPDGRLVVGITANQPAVE